MSQAAVDSFICLVALRVDPVPVKARRICCGSDEANTYFAPPAPGNMCRDQKVVGDIPTDKTFSTELTSRDDPAKTSSFDYEMSLPVTRRFPAIFPLVRPAVTEDASVDGFNLQTSRN